MDTLSESARSERMSRVRGKNTKVELRVRRLVYSLGYRYRLHRHDLPGCPDMAFVGRRKAIFVHGCFWHRHDHCSLARLPKSRLDFWIPKLESNKQRDGIVETQLREMGWGVMVIWECQLNDAQALSERIREFMEEKGKS